MSDNDRGLPSLARLEEVVQAGNKALHRELWKEALAAFENATALKPRCVEAWLGKAGALRGLGRMEGATEAYRDSLKIDSRNVEAWTGLIETLHERRLYREEAEACDRLLRVSPRMDDALLDKGVALHALGKLDGALDCFDQFVARMPENVAALNNRGAVLLRLGRFEDALQSLDRALALDPHLEDAQRNRCLVLLQLRRHGEAVRAASAMLAAREEGWLWMLKGLAHAELKELPLALESLERAKELEPVLVGLEDALDRVRRLWGAVTDARAAEAQTREPVEAHGVAARPASVSPQGVAIALNYIGFPTESLRVWEENMNKDAAMDWIGIARALEAGGEREAAARCFREALNRGGGLAVDVLTSGADSEHRGSSTMGPDHLPRNELHLSWRETAKLVGNGRIREAEGRLWRLLEDGQDLERGWNMLGVLSATDGRLREAEDSLRHATSLDSSYATAWSNLGAVTAASGRLEEAAGALRKALDLDPNHLEALHNLGAVEATLGHNDDARRLLRRALKLEGRPQTWLALAQVMETMNMWREAMNCYAKSLSQGRRNGLAVAGLARTRGRYGARQKSRIANSSRRLEKIPWVGPARGKTLAKAGYRTPSDIKAAKVEELTELPGFNRRVAKQLKKAVARQPKKKGRPGTLPRR